MLKRLPIFRNGGEACWLTVGEQEIAASTPVRIGAAARDRPSNEGERTIV